MKTIRLMLADDHDVIRTGLKTFLETQEDMVVVAEARSGKDALNKAQEVKPDVIIMDISMPEMDGLEATRQLKQLCPECRVLALTVHEDKQYFFEMLAAGASGYMTKQAAAEDLVAAIHTVAQGQVYLQPTLASWLLDDYRRLSVLNIGTHPSADEQHDKPQGKLLSKREIQVLEFIAQGLTTPQISERLGLSPKTVARHRERIMSRLNIHSSAELVKYAIRSGLIQL